MNNKLNNKLTTNIKQNDDITNVTASENNKFERVISDVPYPAETKLKKNDLFSKFTDKPKHSSTIQILKDHLYREGLLEEEVAIKIIDDTTKVFRGEKNIIEVPHPCVIVGDIHGQFYDLLEILNIGGQPMSTRYLFLGDYVDRGMFSVETVLLLWYLKLSFPNNITLLRGNHECKHLTEFFTFKRECLIKYSEKFYDACTRSFMALPLSAIVDKKFFCIHAGLSPQLLTLNDIKKIKRERETPSVGLFCDIMWSDPATDYDEPISKSMYRVNKTRGCSYYYSFTAVEKFLRKNNLASMIRAHEAQSEGYRFYKALSGSDFPSLITIFSAPNYCDVYQNKGAVIVYENNMLNMRCFSAKPHPYQLPNFMDVFTWSMPFLAEKVTEILAVLFKRTSSDAPPKVTAYRREIMRMKILAIARMLILYSRSRAKSEKKLELQKLCPMSNLMPLRKKSQSISCNLRDLDTVVSLEAISVSPSPTNTRTQASRSQYMGCEDDTALNFSSLVSGEPRIVKARSFSSVELKKGSNIQVFVKRFNNLK